MKEKKTFKKLSSTTIMKFWIKWSQTWLKDHLNWLKILEMRSNYSLKDNPSPSPIYQLNDTNPSMHQRELKPTISFNNQWTSLTQLLMTSIVLIKNSTCKVPFQIQILLIIKCLAIQLHFQTSKASRISTVKKKAKILSLPEIGMKGPHMTLWWLLGMHHPKQLLGVSLLNLPAKRKVS